jgi:hypothetical protein
MVETQTARYRVDDIAGTHEIMFFVWVTLNEQKWVIFGERRGRGRLSDAGPDPGEYQRDHNDDCRASRRQVVVPYPTVSNQSFAGEAVARLQRSKPSQSCCFCRGSLPAVDRRPVFRKRSHLRIGAAEDCAPDGLEGANGSISGSAQESDNTRF